MLRLACHNREAGGECAAHDVYTIAAVIKSEPVTQHSERSDRAIARAAGADKNTVAAVRAKAEGTGEIHQLEKRVGAVAKANAMEGVMTESVITDGRHHLTKAEQTRADLARPLGISRQRMSEAMTILAFAADQVDTVIAGGAPFDTAYQTALKRKQDGLSTEARTARLAATAPDLAALVAASALAELMHMRARWMLGRLLAEVERAPGPHDGSAGPGRGNLSLTETSFRSLLEDLELDKNAAMRAQRIGTLPEPDLDKANRRGARQRNLRHLGPAARPLFDDALHLPLLRRVVDRAQGCPQQGAHAAVLVRVFGELPIPRPAG